MGPLSDTIHPGNLAWTENKNKKNAVSALKFAPRQGREMQHVVPGEDDALLQGGSGSLRQLAETLRARVQKDDESV